MLYYIMAYTYMLILLSGLQLVSNRFFHDQMLYAPCWFSRVSKDIALILKELIGVL